MTACNGFWIKPIRLRSFDTACARPLPCCGTSVLCALRGTRGAGSALGRHQRLRPQQPAVAICRDHPVGQARGHEQVDPMCRGESRLASSSRQIVGRSPSRIVSMLRGSKTWKVGLPNRWGSETLIETEPVTSASDRCQCPHLAHLVRNSVRACGVHLWRSPILEVRINCSLVSLRRNAEARAQKAFWVLISPSAANYPFNPMNQPTGFPF